MANAHLNKNVTLPGKKQFQSRITGALKEGMITLSPANFMRSRELKPSRAGVD